MPQEISVLLVEDDQAFAALLGNEIAVQCSDFVVRTAPTLDAATREAARALPAAVLLDLGLPDSAGLETLWRMQDVLPRTTALVVLTAVDDVETARQAIHTGAQDYLVKGTVDGETIVRTLRSAIERAVFRQKLMESEEALRDSEARKRAILDCALDAIVTMDAAGTIVELNPAAEQMFGYSRDRAVGRELADLIIPEEFRAAHRQALARGHATRPSRLIGRRLEVDALRANGERFPIELSVSRVQTHAGVLFTAWVRDITNRRTAEEALRTAELQLRQGQKMEAVGRLAGGIAHDFNNVLTAILGYADLVREHFSPGDAQAADLDEIKRAAQRAATLTRQLLAFSRKQLMLPRRINLNEILTNVEHLLRALLGDDIEVRFEKHDAVLDVHADPGQIEQVVMNLASNAKDAMPAGGRFTITTDAVELDGRAAARFAGLQPGRYARLTIADTGHGMPDAVRSHVFEPFFTTKEQGKGTGLGLATVYGIIKQSGGWIYVDSAPDRGTAFSIYLPHLREEHHEQTDAADRHVILVVEDDDAVRHLTGQSLRRQGHVVFEARSITDGAAIAAERPIGLVICDVGLPDGDGQQLVRRLRDRSPDLRVLYLVGYGEAGLGPRAIAPHEAVLEKPFAPPALTSAVQDVMNATSSL